MARLVPQPGYTVPSISRLPFQWSFASDVCSEVLKLCGGWSQGLQSRPWIRTASAADWCHWLPSVAARRKLGEKPLAGSKGWVVVTWAIQNSLCARTLPELPNESIVRRAMRTNKRLAISRYIGNPSIIGKSL